MRRNSKSPSNEKFANIVALAMTGLILVAVVLVNIHSMMVRNELDSSDATNNISSLGENTVEPDDAPPPTVSPEDTPAPTPAPTPEPTPTPTPTPELRESTTASINQTNNGLTAELDGIAESYKCVAASIATFSGEGGVFDYLTYSYGYADVGAKRLADEETKFRIASLTKYVTVMLAMSLVEKDLLDLDADISDYLGYEAKNPNHPDVPITVRMLMQHTSSIVDANAYKTARRFGEDTVRNLLRTSSMYARRQPGEKFEYSDFAYSVLGAICEKVSGELLGALANEVLFEPLGIDAAFTPSQLQSGNIAALYNSRHELTRSVQTQLAQNTVELGFEHNSAIGDLMISALDYAKILSMMANGGILGDVRILSEESVEEIHTTNVATEFQYEQGLMVRFQQDAFLGDDVYWHTGSAYGLFSQFIYCRDTMRGVVVITTGTAGEREPNNMIKACNALAEFVWE